MNKRQHYFHIHFKLTFSLTDTNILRHRDDGADTCLVSNLSNTDAVKWREFLLGKNETRYFLSFGILCMNQYTFNSLFYKY